MSTDNAGSSLSLPSSAPPPPPSSVRPTVDRAADPRVPPARARPRARDKTERDNERGRPPSEWPSDLALPSLLSSSFPLLLRLRAREEMRAFVLQALPFLSLLRVQSWWLLSLPLCPKIG